MEKHKYGFARFIPLGLRWQFRPDVQGKAILVLLVPKVRRELVEDVEAVSSEIGESRHRRYACWTVCVLSSELVIRYHSHSVSANLPIWKPRKQCLQGPHNASARQTSALLSVLAHT